jgi:TonB family protein
LLVFLGLYAWSELKHDVNAEPQPEIRIATGNYTSPPPIDRRPSREYRAQAPVQPPEFAVPDPVARVDDSDHDFATNEDWAEWIDRDSGFGADFPNGGQYQPAVIDTFVFFDELPLLLSIRDPVYPELPRQAGIDGTVLVKVFVSRTGKVKNAIAIEGPEVLRNAAVDAAKTALFAPAKQGDVPVEVWVMLPVTFSLNR